MKKKAMNLKESKKESIQETLEGTKEREKLYITILKTKGKTIRKKKCFTYLD